MLAATLILTLLLVCGWPRRCWGLLWQPTIESWQFSIFCINKWSWAGGQSFSKYAKQRESQYFPRWTITCHDNNKRVLLVPRSALAQARQVCDCQAQFYFMLIYIYIYIFFLERREGEEKVYVCYWQYVTQAIRNISKIHFVSIPSYFFINRNPN